VVASFKRALDPAIGGAFGTQGVLATYLGTADITAPDDATVRIVTAEPMADLLDLVAAIVIGPERELPQLPRAYVGSGPYKVATQSESRVVLAAHDRYWGPAPRYREVAFVADPDAGKRVDALLGGDADVAAGIGIQGKARIAAAGGAEVHERESGLCIIFMLNAQQGPCRDRRVRQALNYALDVDAIIAGVVNGAATRLNGYLTAHHFGYNPETPVYPHDPEKARRLLAEAGYPNGLTLTFDIPSTMPDEAPALATAMAEQYAKAGITLKIVEHADRAAYSEMVRAKQIHDGCAFDSSPRSTFRVLREKLHSGLRGPWWEGYANPQVDAMIAKAQGTVADSDRQAIYREIYTIGRDDAPWVFLYRPTNYWGARPTVSGWTPRADGLLLLR
jgi:peptide/nickel transport system substrate-binding protein